MTVSLKRSARCSFVHCGVVSINPCDMTCTSILKSVPWGSGCDSGSSYVFSMEGASCTLTTVEPLAVLYCSKLLWSTLAKSTRGRRKPFSDGMDDSTKLPDTELGARWLIRMFTCVVEEDFLWGLEPPTPASSLDAWVLLWKERYKVKWMIYWLLQYFNNLVMVLSICVKSWLIRLICSFLHSLPSQC